MTTIAWDGKTLAADRQETYGGSTRGGSTTKIWRIKSHLLAATGTARDAHKFSEWFENGHDNEQPWPKMRDDFEGVLVKPNGVVLEYNEEGGALLLNVPKWAWGSGASFAIGALAAGASAKEAVETAMRFDVFSGMGIDVLALDLDDQLGEATIEEILERGE